MNKDDERRIRQLAIASARLRYVDLILYGIADNISVSCYDPMDNQYVHFDGKEWKIVESLILKAYPETQDEELMIKKYKEYKIKMRKQLNADSKSISKKN